MFLIRNKNYIYSKIQVRKSTFKKYLTKNCSPFNYVRNYRIVLIHTCPVIGSKRVIVLCDIFIFFAIVEITDFFSFIFADQGITLGRDFSGVIVDVGMTASNEYKIGTVFS